MTRHDGTPEPRTPKQRILALRFQAAKAEAAGHPDRAADLIRAARAVEIAEAERVHARRAAAKARTGGRLIH